jgi:hypothetical protein
MSERRSIVSVLVIRQNFRAQPLFQVQQEAARRAGPLGINGEALRQPIFLIRYPSLVIEPLPRLVSRFIVETSEKDRL